jgi:type II secretion system protein H
MPGAPHPAWPREGRAPMCTVRHTRSAFTLIEVMIVVFILAIIVGMIVPMIGNRADLRLSAAARKLTADLQYAQAVAISTQVSQYVRFSSNQYEIMTRAVSGTSLVAATHPIDKSNFTVVFNNPSVTPELANVTLPLVSVGGTNTLVFDAQGVPSSYNATTGVATPLGSRVTITLNSGTQSVNVYVEAYSGEITASN